MQAQASGDGCYGRLHLVARLVLGTIAMTVTAGTAQAETAASEQTHTLHSFRRVPLTDVYYSEGANFGDINGDGIPDVVYGPYWFAGPDYQEKHEIFPPIAQPRQAYADHFFCWVHDFNGNGWNDILVVGFPGKPAYVYENPTDKGLDQHWKRHQVLDSVANESPQFLQIVGDDQPALVCMSGGQVRVRHVTTPSTRHLNPGEFHAISEKVTDSPVHAWARSRRHRWRWPAGRPCRKDGWYQQPEQLDPANPIWQVPPLSLLRPAVAPRCIAYDVNGNGLNDVITSLDRARVWTRLVRADS
jgi:hypothetical protein